MKKSNFGKYVSKDPGRIDRQTNYVCVISVEYT